MQQWLRNRLRPEVQAIRRGLKEGSEHQNSQMPCKPCEGGVPEIHATPEFNVESRISSEASDVSEQGSSRWTVAAIATTTAKHEGTTRARTGPDRIANGAVETQNSTTWPDAQASPPQAPPPALNMATVPGSVADATSPGASP